jgi:hypothetical protein
VKGSDRGLIWGIVSEKCVKIPKKTHRKPLSESHPVPGPRFVHGVGKIRSGLEPTGSMSGHVKRFRWCWASNGAEIRRLRSGPVLQTSRQLCGFPPSRHVTCNVRYPLWLYGPLLHTQHSFLLRALHFMTREETVPHIFLFVLSSPLCLLGDIDLPILCGFLVTVEC